MKRQLPRLTMLLGVVGLLAALSIFAFGAVASAEWVDTGADTPTSEVTYSHRLIVELESPPLTVKYPELPGARSVDGKLDARSVAAQSYIQQIQAEQSTLMANVQAVLPEARVSTYLNEQGMQVAQQYQVVLNAVVVDAGLTISEGEIEALRRLPGVKAVHRDYARYPQLYTSTHLINAPAVWSNLGGQANAGRGIKLASMDGGIHKDAPMFSGEGFDYPPGYPVGGMGLTANNNGKIIVSRAYFRTWDPPASGDENPWPGQRGTSHGVHTAGIAGGNVVTDATYLGTTLPTMSGVAPGVWLGSYRVFYYSVNGIQSFYNAEGIAALEDIVKDGMDVVNNSWGGGPSSVGGEFDALDTALINASKAGVFVAMSNGNAGPYTGSGDHPSTDYINVAATNSGGTYASGRFSVSAPTPVTPTLQSIPFSTASFGAPLPVGTVTTYTFRVAANIMPANFEGCTPFPAGTFNGVAAVISRGTCEFGVKVLNAENAGASFVVIYNNAAGGDGLINMGPGAVGDQVKISSIFIGNTGGVGLVNWHTQYGDNAEATLDTQAFQLGNQPDVVASFSSRGPSTRNSLKPDIAAPGVNIMSQGYDPLATGEARHLGFGQVSGTSMAAPHVAGAAALLKSLYPNWSNAYIKSALMSTSKFMDVYNHDGTPAQPTDIGAGRLDVAAAVDPGVILMPPAADFGVVMSTSVGAAASVSVNVQVHNIYTATETYTVTTLYTGDSFTATTPLAGVVISPTQITLAPGETKTVQVIFDPAQGMGYDINQGYIVMQGDVHHAHMPFFARVTGAKIADVLLVDADLSQAGLPNYASYYMRTLDNLGVSYSYWDAGSFVGSSRTLADFATLHAFDMIIVFTGDNFYPNGFFTVSTPLTQWDMDLLNEYAQAGGKIFVMGQDATSVMNDSFFQGFTLGATSLQDSVTGNELPALPVVSHNNAPSAFKDVLLDLTGPQTALGQVALLGANEVPPLDNAAQISGTATFLYSNFTNRLSYSVVVNVSEPFTLTNAHIHTGTVGVSGGVLAATWPFTQPQIVTKTLTWSGFVTLTPEQNAHRETGGYYLNVHSSVNTGGEIRGQVPSMEVNGDGAGNQLYIDEFEALSETADPNDPPVAYQHILRYPGPNNDQQGVVAIAHREQPTLERPGVSYNGRSIVTAFGLEGVNNGVGATSREALLDLFFKWAMDEPTVTISHTQEVTTSEISAFNIAFTSPVTQAVPVSHRWDFGDGTPYTAPFQVLTPVVYHKYAECGDYTVRVEVTDNYGNKTIGERTVTITACTSTPQYSIEVSANPVAGGSVSGGGTVDEGAMVTVTATANPGYMFLNWTENGAPVSSQAVYTFTATASRNLVANFVQAVGLSVMAEPTEIMFSESVTLTAIVTGSHGAPLAGETVLATDGVLTAQLSGANEVPANDSTATGVARFVANPMAYNFATNTLPVSYTLSVEGLENITGAHVHYGAAGVNGGVAYPIQVGAGSFDLKAADLPLMLTGQLYVNVHTQDFQGGEIRGQILGAAMGVTDENGMVTMSFTPNYAGTVTIYVAPLTNPIPLLRTAVVSVAAPSTHLYMPIISR